MAIYVPILKWKQGEYFAFSKLTPSVRDSVLPLFEITPPDYDFEDRAYKKTLDEHLKTFSARYKKYCQGRPIIIDTQLVPPDMRMGNGMLPLEYLVNDAEMKLIPTFSVRSTEEHLKIVGASTVLNGAGACLRLSLADLLDTELQSKIDNLLNLADLSFAEVDLLVDLERPTQFDPVEDFAEMLTSLLATPPYLLKWRSFILAATSFPKSMTEVTASGEKWARKEWLTYQKLILSGKLPRVPIYSDYGIGGPGYEVLDFRKITRKCSLKYTLADAWVVLKGKKSSKVAGWMQDYHDLCHTLASSSLFMGKDYSAGDKRIHECALQKKDASNPSKKTSSGNPSTWVEAGVNHHITMVINALSS